MTSRFPITATGACLLAAWLSACGPSVAPYEPPEPAAAPEEAAEAVVNPPPDMDGESDDRPAAGEVALDEDDPDAMRLDAEERIVLEAHEHGAAELSVTRDDVFLTLTLDAPLANFGLSETDAPSGSEAEAYADGIAVPVGPTDCEETERSVDARTSNGHGAMIISVVWRCARIERVEGMRLNVFTLYPDFRKVDAVYLGPDGHQTAAELTPKSDELDFD